MPDAVVASITDLLTSALRTFIVSKVALVERKLKVRAKTSNLAEPGQLPQLVGQGTVKPGNYVQGDALFSLHTQGPAVRIAVPTLTIGALRMCAAPHPVRLPASLSTDAMSDFYSSMRFPIVNDTTRVGYLYPTSMRGFAVPMVGTDGLPFKRSQLCLAKQADLHGIENQVVSYRGLVVELPRSAFRESFPYLSDNHYERWRQDGLLTLISFTEEDTYIRPNSSLSAGVLYGGHFLRAHWEIDAYDPCASQETLSAS